MNTEQIEMIMNMAKNIGIFRFQEGFTRAIADWREDLDTERFLSLSTEEARKYANQITMLENYLKGLSI